MGVQLKGFITMNFTSFEGVSRPDMSDIWLTIDEIMAS